MVKKNNHIYNRMFLECLFAFVPLKYKSLANLENCLVDYILLGKGLNQAHSLRAGRTIKSQNV